MQIYAYRTARSYKRSFGLRMLGLALGLVVWIAPVYAQEVLRIPYVADIGTFDPDNGFETGAISAIDNVYEGSRRIRAGFDQDRWSARQELGDFRRRADLHLPPGRRREVPRWHAIQCGGGHKVVRAPPRSWTDPELLPGQREGHEGARRFDGRAHAGPSSAFAPRCPLQSVGTEDHQPGSARRA